MESKPNYLKNYRIVLYYFRDCYNLKISQIEFLFFVYDLKYFTYCYVSDNYRSSRTFVDHTLPDLFKKGYIAVYQERAHNRARKYKISQTGKLLVSRFYRILEDKYFDNNKII